jgi:hypothetical protein
MEKNILSEEISRIKNIMGITILNEEISEEVSLDELLNLGYLNKASFVENFINYKYKKIEPNAITSTDKRTESEREAIIDQLLSSKKFMEQLNPTEKKIHYDDIILTLFRETTDIKKVLNKLDRIAKSYFSVRINKNEGDSYIYGIRDRKKVDIVIEFILTRVGGYLDQRTKTLFLSTSHKPHKILKMMGESGKDFIKQIMNNRRIASLFSRNTNNDGLINVLLDYPGMMNIIDDDRIYTILSRSTNPSQIMTKLGEKGIKFINRMRAKETYQLLKGAEQPARLYKTLKTMGDDEMKEILKKPEIKHAIKSSKTN